MKETAVVMPVFSCSLCKYWSLQKPHVSKHLTAKCVGATLVKEEKLVKHRDLTFECDDIATLYQCSNCDYTSQQSTNVKTHTNTKCKGATVLSEKRKLVFEDVPKKQDTSYKTTTTGNVNQTHNVLAVNVADAPVTQNNLMLVIAANSEEEFAERLKIFYQVSRENGIEFEKGEFMPSALLKGFEEANPKLDNKVCKNNTVVCLKTGERTPLMKYARQELLNIFNLITKQIETFAFGDEDENEFIDKLIRMIIDSEQIENSKYTLKQYHKKYEDYDVYEIREDLAQLIQKDTERTRTKYYSTIYNVVLDLLSHRLCEQEIPQDIVDNIRNMLKDIATHLRAKKTTVGRPSNTINLN